MSLTTHQTTQPELTDCERLQTEREIAPSTLKFYQRGVNKIYAAWPSADGDIKTAEIRKITAAQLREFLTPIKATQSPTTVNPLRGGIEK